MVSIDIDRPSTWKKYRASLCDDCWAGCCTMPVEVKAEDIVRLGLSDHEQITSNPRKVAKQLIKEGILKSYRESTGLFMLEQKTNRDCIYLDEKRLCKVYEKRPDVCRKFPDVGPRPGWCPHRYKSQG